MNDAICDLIPLLTPQPRKAREPRTVCGSYGWMWRRFLDRGLSDDDRERGCEGPLMRDARVTFQTNFRAQFAEAQMQKSRPPEGGGEIR